MSSRDDAIKNGELFAGVITHYDGRCPRICELKDEKAMRARLHHVNIPALKFAETIAFYRDIFGLVDIEPTFASDYKFRDGTHFVGPSSSEASDLPAIHISDPTPEYARAVTELGINPRLNGHLAIAVDDIEEVKSRLDAAGIFFVDAGRWAVKDFYQLYTYDPSMNLVEINQAF